ncbi:TPA: terminase small subunit [Staphylococcus aureus]|nr:terminase small subunit [Staphylococcus aureus]
MSELMAKQARFVNEYIRTLNVTQSAIKAGYSANSAHVTGCRLLKKPHIKQYIQEQKDKIIDENVLTAKELLHVLTNAAVGDETETKEVVVKRGEYKENPQSGKVQLVYNEHVELIEVPIKPSDRLKARDMLGKYHKLFTDKHDINGDVPIFINIGEWDGDDEELDKTVKDVSNANPNHTVIVDDIPLED